MIKKLNTEVIEIPKDVKVYESAYKPSTENKGYFVNAFCNKHKIYYKAYKFNGELGVLTNCPFCNEMLEKEKIEKEKIEIIENQKENERLNQKYKEIALQKSNLPKRILQTKLAMTDNFIKYKEFLNQKIQNNFLVYGNVGTGKTLYASVLLRNNLDLFPQYHIATDLAFIVGYEKQNFLNSLNGCELLVIDESFNVDSIDLVFFEAIINKIYNNCGFIVMVANVKSADLFFQKLSPKVSSRFRENLKALEFLGNDKRNEKK